jgi:hypothetical protein
MPQSVAQALALICLLLSTINSWAGVGKVTEQTGPTEIVRAKKSIPSSLNTAVEMNDAVSTAKATAQLTFDDKTTVKINEHSKIVIDDFVYDPNKGTGKLAMKMALGTARYTSGQIAKNNPQQVAINTPTASVGVRGTDFSMTVDEMGRSLIVLLPSCDNKGCVTGAIEVRNEGGVVLLDVPYQATMVVSAYAAPSQPVVVKLEQANINNMLIISKPAEIQDDGNDHKKALKERGLLDFDKLDVDLLKYTKLDENKLENFRELDRNDLNADLLAFYSWNELDSQNKTLLSNEIDVALLPNYNAASGLLYYFNEDQSKVTLYRVTNHTASVTLPTTQNTTLSINQDGQQVVQQVNKGATSTITITQK